MIHNISPVYDENSRVLLLGSFPSPKSRAQGFFYGHPQNRMWRVLAAVYGTEVPQTAEERKSFLLRHGIAMWDVLQSCDIDGASDSSISNETPNDLDILLGPDSVCRIEAVFLTGTKAWQYYKKYDAARYGTAYYRLPSTSPANAAASLSRLVDEYIRVRRLPSADSEY